jgi:ATP synthase protein I
MRYNFQALPAAERPQAMLRRLSKPIRTIVRWQLGATVVLALIAGLAAGGAAAISATAGGLVSVAAGLAAAWVAARSSAKSAGGVLLGALRAEAVRIGLALFLLWLVLANVGGVVVTALLGSFVVTMIIFSMAFFVRDY